MTVASRRREPYRRAGRRRRAVPALAEVGRRLFDMAAQKNITRRSVVANNVTRRSVVANNVSGEEDLEAIRRFLGVEADLVIADDGAMRTADRMGASPIDHDPGWPAVGALRQLASSLLV